MPRSGCSAFYGVNPSKKVKSYGNKRKVRAHLKVVTKLFLNTQEK